ncbi:type III PLP-dependent enzyme [Gottfriedia acidiceleris]|uniref:type III PLP-dependent enzyme n=1 Tax=Gottfriedia acidiceleris TaxID=371036 RepID=UPI002FFE4B5B
MIANIVQTQSREQDRPFCAYLYDLTKLRNHVNSLMTTLPSSCRLFYAIKANSDEMILKALAPIVNGFEVASLGEIEKVRNIDCNIPILFGGPGKTRHEIEMAIEYGVTLLHVESLHEIKLVNYIAMQKHVSVSILLRVNLRHSVPSAKLKMAGVPTQFGIDETEIDKAISLIEGLPNLKLEGFHYHAMSNNTDSKSHASFVDHCYGLTKEWRNKWNLDITYVNVGGGIGINYLQVDKQFDWEDFTEQLEKVLEKHNDKSWNTLFECGRYLTSSCGYYAAEVLDIKQNHGEYFCILRGGSHHLRLPAAWKQSHPFTVIPVGKWPYSFERPEVIDERITVAGELCTPNDVLAREVIISKLRVGDILLFSYAGAYGWAISHHNFLSHPHPERIYVDRDSLIRQYDFVNEGMSFEVQS